MKIGRTFFRLFPKKGMFKIWHYGKSDDDCLVIMIKAARPFFKMWRQE